MSTETNTEKGKSLTYYIKGLTSNPWFGITGWVLCLAGVIVTIILSSALKRDRDLVYAVSPIRTAVVTAGQASELDILYRGNILGDVDITAAQVAIWNKGKQSIRPENILEEVVIITEPPVPILEASVKSGSRDVTAFTLIDTSESRIEGKVPLSWRILEYNDGASVQIIYIGSDDINIIVRGTIEGLRGINCVELGVKIESPTEQIRRQQSVRWVWIFMAVITGGGTLYYLVDALRRKYKWENYIVIIGPLGPFVISIWQLLSTAGASWPPFGF